jgi:hypothetical protein
MRRPFALLAAIWIALALPAAASAGRATRLTDHPVNLSCDGVHPITGTGFAFFGASLSDLDGPGLFLDMWDAEEPVDAPDLSADQSQGIVVTWNGTTLSGSFQLVTSTGDPAGSATFFAAMTPVGDPFPINDSFKNGNQKFQFMGTGQALQPAGSLVLSTGTTFDLSLCSAETATVSVFATNPASSVTHFASRSVGCDLTDGAGNTGFMFVDLNETESFVEASVSPANGDPSISAFGSGTVVGGTLDTQLDTFFSETGEPAGVPASIHVTFVSTGERFEVLMRNSRERRIFRGTLLDIEGTLTIGTYSFDLTACVGEDYRVKDIISAKNGPKPGGKAPANDLPSGAELLAVGGSTHIQTRGASPDREATFECEIFEEPSGVMFEIPISNTVWYRFIGTGGPVTVDTAGSDFDTVVAVYTLNGGGAYTPVPDGCVDDVPVQPFGRTVQAWVTIPTVAGTTYFVQIGGFPEAPPFGNLRVSIR